MCRAACLLVVASLTLAGCSAFGKKAPTPASRPPDIPHQPRTEGTNLPEGANGLLAGKVIDSFNRRPPITQIQVVAVPGGEPTIPPVMTDTMGYFTIQRLEPGRHYQLIARAKDGDRVLGGITLATPPDPRVLIRISEDFVSPATAPGTKPPPKDTPKPGTSANNGGSSTGRAAELGTPVPGNGSAAVPPPAGGNRPRPDLSRAINVPNPHGPPTTPTAGTDQPRLTTPTGAPARIPFCELTGSKVENFGLHDLDGRPWEFRQHKGRLVLIDFWFTTCRPCLEALPHLNILHQNYGRYGLEVIGIAYEDGSFEDQTRKVNNVRGRLNLKYKLLLGGPGDTCPVKAKFGVDKFPTLFLVDENGEVLWRSEGLAAPQLSALENELKRRLVGGR